MDQAWALSGRPAMGATVHLAPAVAPALGGDRRVRRWASSAAERSCRLGSTDAHARCPATTAVFGAARLRHAPRRRRACSRSCPPVAQRRGSGHPQHVASARQPLAQRGAEVVGDVETRTPRRARRCRPARAARGLRDDGRVFGLSRSGFHAWTCRAPSPRQLGDERLTARIRRLVGRSIADHMRAQLVTDTAAPGRIERLAFSAAMNAEDHRRVSLSCRAKKAAAFSGSPAPR